MENSSVFSQDDLRVLKKYLLMNHVKISSAMPTKQKFHLY